MLRGQAVIPQAEFVEAPLGREALTGWTWVSKPPLHPVSTGRAVASGHQRWDIKNYSFNEMANGWHTGPIYEHQPSAIVSFLWAAFLAALNRKPEIRKGRTRVFRSRLIAVEVDAGINPAISTWTRRHNVPLRRAFLCLKHRLRFSSTPLDT